MKYIRLFLRGFKPLLYGGTHQIDIQDIPQIVILSGENGKGKSSILRELTPYPATRTDYEKNGLKIIEIEHLSHYYILTSDFSKTGAHSFKRDDVELNISGTTDVQSDLVQQYFEGFIPLVEKLMSGQYKFSAMNKNERKQVIMTTYPSSLLFILTKYKNLMTKIHAYQNQMKLLKERQLKLKEALVDDSVLNEHRRNQKNLNERILDIDKRIYALEEQLRPYRDSDSYRRTFTYTEDDIVRQSKELEEQINKLIHDKNYVPCTSLNLDASIVKAECDIQHLNDVLSSDDKLATDLKSEIEKYQDYLSIDHNELIKDCEREIDIQKSIIKEFTYDDNVPVVDKDTCQHLRDISSTVKEQLDILHDSSIVLWNADSQNEKDQMCRVLEADMRLLSGQKNALDEEITREQKKLDKYSSKDYPLDCRRGCHLRESIEDIMNTVRMEIGRLTKSRDDISVKLADMQIECRKLKNDIALHVPTLPIIRRFEKLLDDSEWGGYVLNRMSFIDAANTNIFDIWNRYVRVVKKSEAHHKVENAKDTLNLLEGKLANLKAENIPAKKIISKTLLEKEVALNKLLEKRAGMTKMLSSLKNRWGLMQEHKHLLQSVTQVVCNWKQLSEHLQIKAIVEFIEQQIRDLSSSKIEISDKLRDIDSIVKEQDGLRLRLSEEIEPMINQLSASLFKLSIIEKQLSPTSGLPHKNIIRYINALFTKANAFIKQVWNYQMELEYLKESEDCDYVFRVIINSDGIVKDINMCSKGQKEIIDLAIILAIATYRKYATMFPLKLDEMSSGLSPEHSLRLFDFFGDMFHDSGIIQTFIVNHDPIVTSSFADAGYAVLSQDYPLPASCRVITKIN